MTTESNPGVLGRAGWMLTPLALGILSRIVAVAAIIWANGQRPDPLRNPFVAWDGLWYLSIAQSGYHAEPLAGSLRDIAFFPGWPLLVRALTPPGWDPGFVAPVLANVLFVVACVLLWRVLADRLDAAVATAGVALLAFSPAAYTASMAYSEPLYLVLAAAAFLSTRRPAVRAVAVAAAMATRIAGSALVLVEIVGATRARGRERLAHLVVAAAGAAAFAGWWAYVGWLMQDPLGFLRGSPSWGGETGVASFVQALSFAEIPQVVALGLLFVFVGGALSVARRDRELGIYALACLALTVLPGGLVSSSPRYAIAAFPAFAGLAMVLRGRLASVALIGSAALEILWTYWALVEVRAP